MLVEPVAAGRPPRIPSPTLPPAKSRLLHSHCCPALWGSQIRSRPAHQVSTGRQLVMAEPLASSQDAPNHPASEQRVVVANRHGENLVGVLHHTGSNKVVVLCHGFTATKDDSIILDLTAALTKKGISVFRFDFSGNGQVTSALFVSQESEGDFQYGNYRKEADDLHSVVSYLSQEKYDVTTVVGHSKGLFFTIHGSADEVIPVEDAYEFAKLIPNHKLRVIEGANHCYTAHRKEVSDTVVDCITLNEIHNSYHDIHFRLIKIVHARDLDGARLAPVRESIGWGKRDPVHQVAPKA
ncbi:hypothetical protein PR202_ga10710 [Eleusine coracana subsp. coracana]|uniref:Serine aminopeptidase S33 domain-containing protein n=1 Tax=Eleusine coracana subsp. coracana TaxID=191504 RepID=A0AAV5C7D0_ELECO|nr:hypothetical protein PR202_ga10710 [Eleusine coracana subsp. coracana]